MKFRSKKDGSVVEWVKTKGLGSNGSPLWMKEEMGFGDGRDSTRYMLVESQLYEYWEPIKEM